MVIKQQFNAFFVGTNVIALPALAHFIFGLKKVCLILDHVIF